ncbi:MAG TPA: NAD(P)-dependent oxidoreductase [bacterium]
MKVGFIGLGTMGRPMAENLIKAGCALVVWNRTPARTRPLEALGAKPSPGPAQVAAEAEIVITMVTGPEDVEQVVLGPDGVLEGIRPGAVLIDMSTVTPMTSRKLAAGATTRQAEFLDAPVVGSVGPAAEGTLVILAGGLPTTLERCRPVLEAMGRTVIHAGGVGMGSALKLATNLMLAHLMAGLAEGLLLTEQSGIEPARYLEVLQASPFRSRWYETKGAGLAAREFAPHFALKHMHKDLRLIRALAEEQGAALPVTRAVEELFARADADGLGELDYSAVFSWLLGRFTGAGQRLDADAG